MTQWKVDQELKGKSPKETLDPTDKSPKETLDLTDKGLQTLDLIDKRPKDIGPNKQKT